MGSLRTKFKKNNKRFAEGWKHTHPSKKHYRPHHHLINKQMERFDNDGIFAVELDNGDDIIDIDTGINKRRWEFSDFDYNDEMKDGNNRY